MSVGFFWSVLSFIVALGPLIFLHELGHYWVGRWFGVKADAFSIGFGREIAGWTDRRGTRWKVGWMPLGGYVKFAGDMNPASAPTDEWLALPPEERRRTFQAKPAWQRFLIVLAGPAANFLFAIIGFMILFAVAGTPNAAASVASVVPDGPAAQAGVAPGDTIVEIDGNPVGSFTDVQAYVGLRPNEPMTFVVERAGERRTLNLVTGERVDQDQFGNQARVGSIGVMRAQAPDGSVPRDYLPLYRLPGAAIGATFDAVHTMVVALGQVITGRRSVQELGGPLKIGQVAGQQATLGWIAFFSLMVVISINLGFINLLPVPLLDGGHLLFYAIEAVRRKPMKAEAQEWAFRTGLVMLLALMIFVTFNDLASFGLFRGLGG